jgi:ribonuclease D
MSLEPLYDLFRHEATVKVFHAARQDLEIFFVEGKVFPDAAVRHAGRRHGLRLWRTGRL